VVIDNLFVRRVRVDCVVDIFVGLVICAGYVIFEGLVDNCFLMTGDKDGRSRLISVTHCMIKWVIT